MALAVLAGHAVHAHHKGVGVVGLVVVLDLDLFSGGVTLTAAAAAAGQVMYIAVNAIADHGGQNQYNNNICHRYTSSKLALANSLFRIH